MGEYLEALACSSSRARDTSPAIAEPGLRVRDPSRLRISPDETQRFLERARGDRLDALYVLAVTAGLRQGELLGLRWRDLDLDKRAYE